jgi:hypothetical protein
MTNKVIRDDVTITYEEVIPEDKQMAEFYVYDNDMQTYAVLEYKDRVLDVARNGEMYISIPSEDLETGEWVEHEINICRYSDDLERFAETDQELYDLIHLWSVEREYEIYHNNPWWEVWSDDVLPEGAVMDSFYEAIDWAIKFIKDDENWEATNA